MPAKTPEVFAHLEKCAGEGRTSPYSEIGEVVGLANQSVKRPLNYIRDNFCRPNELPWITALAVRKDTGYPGSGWHRHTGNVPVREAHLPVFWSGIVQQVFATDWSKGQSLPRPC